MYDNIKISERVMCVCVCVFKCIIVPSTQTIFVVTNNNRIIIL